MKYAHSAQTSHATYYSSIPRAWKPFRQARESGEIVRWLISFPNVCRVSRLVKYAYKFANISDFAFLTRTRNGTSIWSDYEENAVALRALRSQLRHHASGYRVQVHLFSGDNPGILNSTVSCDKGEKQNICFLLEITVLNSFFSARIHRGPDAIHRIH